MSVQAHSPCLDEPTPAKSSWCLGSRWALCLQKRGVMSEELRSEILVPTRPHLRRAALVALGCGVLGASFGLLAVQPRAQTVTIVAIPGIDGPERMERVERVQIAAMISAPPAAPAPSTKPVRSTELSLLVSAGGASYMKLVDIGEDGEVMPKHGAAKLHDDDGVLASVASVVAGDVPKAYRGWLGRDVIVDGTCKTKVTGFAVISQLTGETGYAGVEDEAWTAQNVLDHGAVVLAAKLASCKGTYARAAELPPIIVPEELEDPALAAKARAALIESAPARDTEREWLAADRHGNWWDDEYVQFSTRVVRHPTTGVTFVSVHGSVEHGCGDAEVNVWGLYRVTADGSLAAVQLRKLGELWSIDKLIDVDNDGELEVIGRPWLGLDTVLVRASGEELERVSLPFFGCPC